MIQQATAYLSEVDRNQFEVAIREKASGVETWPEHWIRPDHGLSYCFECATKQLAKNKADGTAQESDVVDGGWGIEGDGQAYCDGDGCGKMLSNDYTEYACEEMLSHFECDGFDLNCQMSCYYMSEVIASLGWHAMKGNGLLGRQFQFLIDFESEIHKRLHAVVRDALLKMKQRAGR